MNDLLDIALKFIDLGYNVIFVSSDKRPVGIEKYDDCYSGRRITHDEVKTAWRRVRNRASGIALLGVVNPEYPDYHLVIIDIDNPDVWKEKVVPKLSEVIRKLILQSWIWFTGPRCPKCGDKHSIKCIGDECIHETCGTKFKLSDAKRGIAIALLVPSKCIILREGTKKLLGGAIEIRWRGYELIPPSIHPSGVRYEWANGEPIDKPSPLSCEEWKELLEALGYFESRREIEESPVGLKRECKTIRSLTDEQIMKAIEIIKQVYKPLHRNNVLFGIVGWLWHRCVDYESARKLVERLTEWALSEGLPDEDPKHNFYILDWTYGKAGGKSPNRRVWGRPKLLEAVQAVFENPQYYGMSSEEARVRAIELIKELERIFGFRYHRYLVSIIIESKYRGNRIEWIVNDPNKGIIISAKMWNKRDLEKCVKDKCESKCSEKCSGEENECNTDKCVRECRNDRSVISECLNEVSSWGFKWIAHFYFTKVRRYIDKITHDTYYSVIIAKPGTSRKIRLRYVKISDLVEYMKDRGIVDSSRARDALSAILSKWPTKTIYDYITLGVVPSEDGSPRVVFYSPLAKYFRKYYRDVTEEKAVEVYKLLREFIRKWYNDSPKVWRAIAVGLFQGLNFFRKCHGLRNRLLLLAGESETGKSTIARMVLMMYGLCRRELMIKLRKGAATVFSAPRLARAVVLTTFPVVIDEGKTFADRQEVAELIKNLTDNLTIYEVAKAYTISTIQFPAYAGLIMTTQYVHITDVGVRSRFEILWFTQSEQKPKDKQSEFNNELSNIENMLGYVGAWYVKYLIEHWEDVKNIILQGDPVKAAVDYLRTLFSTLGIEPPNMEIDEVITDAEFVDEIERLRYEIYNMIEHKAVQIYKSNDISFIDAIKKVIELNMLAPYGIRYHAHDDSVVIYTDIIHRLRLGSLKNIYEKIRQYCPSVRYVKSHGRYVLKISMDEFIGWLLREEEHEEQ